MPGLMDSLGLGKVFGDAMEMVEPSYQYHVDIAMERAKLAERERCAKVAETVAEYVSGKFDSASCYYIAELIRKGT